MDWILRLLLHDGLSRYWLAQGELAQARREAEALRELAAPPGERSYLALAHRTLAEIAMAAGRWDEAENEVSRALAALEGKDAPSAEWRVCATAAQLYEQLGHIAEAARHWRRSADALDRNLGAGASGTLTLDAQEGTVTIVLDRILYVKRYSRESRVGFAG